MIVRLRPSSHSEDGTIVAVFDNSDQAKLYAKKLARELKCASCSSFGDKVKVGCIDCEYGTLEKARDLLEGYGAKHINETKSYQKLVISVVLPKGLTAAATPLVLDSNTAELIRALSEVCPKPTKHETRKKTVLTFEYEGPSIYFPFRKPGAPFGELWIKEKPIPIPKNFKVVGLI